MKYSKYISLIAATGDIVIMNVCFNIVFWYLKRFDFESFTINELIFPFFINLVWIISANIFEAYKVDHHSYKKVILFNNTKTVIFFFFLFLLYFQVLTFNYYTRDQVKYLFVGFFSALILWKFLLYYTFLWYRKLGYNYRNVIVVGTGATANNLKHYFNVNKWTGYRFKGFFTYEKSNAPEVEGTYEDMENFVKEHAIDEIYIITNKANRRINKAISNIMGKYPVQIRLVPELSIFSFKNFEFVEYDMVPVMKVKQGPLDYWFNRAVKRLADLLISTFAILFVLSWIVPILFIVDLFSGFQGVFFTQKRSGINNQEFTVYKFRTMKRNGDAHLRQATENDQRITKLGRFLRKTSIDELPQFINVLIGNMSVIGPRPHMLKHTDEYKAQVDKFMIRHAIKPGITGYAQIRGFRGEIKEKRDLKQRVLQDVYYIENWSIWLDMKIVFLTFSKIFTGDERAY